MSRETSPGGSAFHFLTKRKSGGTVLNFWKYFLKLPAVSLGRSRPVAEVASSKLLELADFSPRRRVPHTHPTGPIGGNQHLVVRCKRQELRPVCHTRFDSVID